MRFANFPGSKGFGIVFTSRRWFQNQFWTHSPKVQTSLSSVRFAGTTPDWSLSESINFPYPRLAIASRTNSSTLPLLEYVQSRSGRATLPSSPAPPFTSLAPPPTPPLLCSSSAEPPLLLTPLGSDRAHTKGVVR